MERAASQNIATGPFHVATVATGGNDSNDGSPDTPVATVAQGVKLAATAGGGDVLVAVGRYDGPVVVPAGVTIRGGYSSSFGTHAELTPEQLRSPSRAPEDFASSTVLIDGTSNTGPVILADDAKGDIGLEDLVVIGPHAAPEHSSYTVVLRRCSRVRLDRVKLVAGDGGPGRPGTKGADATHFSCSGGAGGIARRLTEHRGQPDFSDLLHWYSDDATPGSPGTSVMNAKNELLAKGGEGGAIGKGTSTEKAPTGEPGHPGGPGANGHVGAPGHPNPDRLGGFCVDGTWTGNPSGAGGRGIPGAGGGGGGPGGSIYQPGVSFYYETAERVGGVGGQGLPGGSGGDGGAGGQPGGGSFALVIVDSVVEGEMLGIVQGSGGEGGDSGPGGAGRAGKSVPADSNAALLEAIALAKGKEGFDPNGEYEGGTTYVGNTGYSAGWGGNGGTGGSGGPGGDGGGGNGGPSIGIAVVEGGTLALAQLHVCGGRAGRGGRSVTGEPGHVGLCRQRADFNDDPLVPVYDDFDAATNNYVFSVDKLPRAADWTRRTPAFYAFSRPVPGSVPIMLELSTANDDTSYQLTLRSPNDAKAAGWIPLGVAFHAYDRPGPDTATVFVETPEGNPHSRYYFSTRSAAEALASRWMQLGALFYAPPAPRRD